MEVVSSGFSIVEPPIFDGENYQVWAIKMQAFMEGCDLWEAMEEDYDVAPLPANPTMNQVKYHKERTTRMAKAKSCLYAAISPTIFTRIMKCKSTNEIWEFLKVEYEGDEKVRGMKVLNLLREFERQQIKETETMNEYIESLVVIADKIRILETDLKDERLVQKILVSLPKRFEATIASLENTKDLSEIKLAELMSALQAQEQRRLMKKEELVEGVLQAKLKLNKRGKKKKWSQTKGNSSDSKSTTKEGGSSDSEGWKKDKKSTSCQHCGRTGHPHFKCWRRPDVKCRRCHKTGHMKVICKEKSQQQTEEAQTAENEAEQLFIASYFNSHVESDAWLVDSGCTNHMTGDLKLFIELDKSVKSKVRVGNGQHIEVQGKGIVAIEGNGNMKLINDVLYVPKIDQNLLNVCQLV